MSSYFFSDKMQSYLKTKESAILDLFIFDLLNFDRYDNNNLFIPNQFYSLEKNIESLGLPNALLSKLDSLKKNNFFNNCSYEIKEDDKRIIKIKVLTEYHSFYKIRKKHKKKARNIIENKLEKYKDGELQSHFISLAHFEFNEFSEIFCSAIEICFLKYLLSKLEGELTRINDLKEKQSRIVKKKLLSVGVYEIDTTHAELLERDNELITSTQKLKPTNKWKKKLYKKVINHAEDKAELKFRDFQDQILIEKEYLSDITNSFWLEQKKHFFSSKGNKSYLYELDIFRKYENEKELLFFDTINNVEEHLIYELLYESGFSENYEMKLLSAICKISLDIFINTHYVDLVVKFFDEQIAIKEDETAIYVFNQDKSINETTGWTRRRVALWCYYIYISNNDNLVVINIGSNKEEITLNNGHVEHASKILEKKFGFAYKGLADYFSEGEKSKNSVKNRKNRLKKLDKSSYKDFVFVIKKLTNHIMAKNEAEKEFKIVKSRCQIKFWLEN